MGLTTPSPQPVWLQSTTKKTGKTPIYSQNTLFNHQLKLSGSDGMQNAKHRLGVSYH
jgi:hypothetical protein